MRNAINNPTSMEATIIKCLIKFEWPKTHERATHIHSAHIESRVRGCSAMQVVFRTPFISSKNHIEAEKSITAYYWRDCLFKAFMQISIIPKWLLPTEIEQCGSAMHWEREKSTAIGIIMCADGGFQFRSYITNSCRISCTPICRCILQNLVWYRNGDH